MTDTSIKSQGSKWTPGYRPAREIAKDIRNDIKAAIRASNLPVQIEGKLLTYRTTIQNYAGGCSISVAVDGVPDSWHFRLTEPGDPYHHEGRTVMTDEAKALRQAVNEIREAYNQDRSDVMTDYFHVTYYGSADLWDERTQAFWQRERDRKARRAS